jgi:hypothetical protein
MDPEALIFLIMKDRFSEPEKSPWISETGACWTDLMIEGLLSPKRESP